MRDAKIKLQEDIIKQGQKDFDDVLALPPTADLKKNEKRAKDMATARAKITEAKEVIRRYRLIRENDADAIVDWLTKWEAKPKPTKTSTRFNKTNIMEEAIMTAIREGQETIDKSFNDKEGQPRPVGTKAPALRASFKDGIGVGYKLLPDFTVVEAKNLRKVVVYLIISDSEKRHYMVETAYPE
jgi:hypothetical protein